MVITFNRQHGVARLTLRFLCYFAALVLLACGSWIERTFGTPTIQQLLYHLYFLEGLILTADNVFLLSFIGECLIAPIVVTILIFSMDRYIDGFLRADDSVAAARSVAGWLVRAVHRVRRGSPTLLLIVSLLVISSQFAVLSYAKATFAGDDYFGKAYIDPDSVRITPGSPKNLVLIYVESLESAYSDAEIFGADLLESLSDLPGVSFASYRPAPGTGWTMAGIVATQCGIPLYFVTRMSRVGESANENGVRVDSFLPNATCLPDILHTIGYRNVFLGGANLKFAGKEKFLTDHHYDEVYGSVEWLADRANSHEVNGWGIYDDDLFQLARDKIKGLYEAGSPFNLTLLTLDTHHPEGHYSKLCRQRGARQFTDIVKCTSEQIADFVDFLRAKGYLHNTNIVVMGDHLAMPNPVYETLTNVSNRRIFNKFISEAPVSKNTEDIVPFDMLPTILEFLGFEVEDNRLGLGYSAFFDTEYSRAKDTRLEFLPEMLNYSEAYARLWDAGADVKSAHD